MRQILPSASDSRFWWWVGYYRRKVTINGPLNFLLKGTGFLNVSNAGSELYADDLYESNSGMRHDRGYFNVSNGGKIHVKGTSRLTYLQGNVSGEGSQ